MSTDIYALNLCIEHSGELWWEQNIFCSFTTRILAKLSTWCFEHFGDISCSVLVHPGHTDESWEGRNTSLWIYTLWIYSLRTLENTDKNKVFFCSSITTILAKLSTWCFEPSGDISCYLRTNLSHTDASWKR